MRLKSTIRLILRSLLLSLSRVANGMYLEFYRWTGESLAALGSPVDVNRPTRYVARDFLLDSEEAGDWRKEITVTLFTFEARQATYFEAAVSSFFDADLRLPVNVFVNGNLDWKSIDAVKRQSLIRNLSRYPNVSLFTFWSMNGWSANTNYAVEFTPTDFSLLIQDDVVIYPRLLERDIKRMLAVSQRFGMCLANREFSTFMISGAFLDEMGWFDERYVGFGQEDGDFARRYMNRWGKPVPSIRSSAFKHLEAPERGDAATGKTGKHSLINDVVEHQLRSEGAEQWITSPKPYWSYKKGMYDSLAEKDSNELKKLVSMALFNQKKKHSSLRPSQAKN